MLDVAKTEPRGPWTQPLAGLVSRLELRLVDPDGGIRVQALDDRPVDGFRAGVRCHPMMPAAGITRGWEVEISLLSLEAHSGRGVQVVLPIEGPVTRFMVPGIVYGGNWVEGCRIRYPRVSADGRGGDALTSDHWAFRADRASHPVVLAWTGSSCVALAVDESSPVGLNGLGFRGGVDAQLLLNFPAREEPVTYLDQDAPGASEVLTHDWRAGEIVTLTFRIFSAEPEPHAYNSVLRAVYRRDRLRHRLNPWIAQEGAAALTAHVLHRWHYRGVIMAETAAFHQTRDETAPMPPARDQMPAAAISGALPAFALLAYARRNQAGDYADAAVSVLDTIAERTSSGLRDSIHTRALAEATLFMIRALRLEENEGIDHSSWKSAIVATLSVVIQSQRDGVFPSTVNGPSADGREDAAGLLWIPALLEGVRGVDGDATRDGTDAAALAGSAYARFVDDEFIYGAQDQIDLAPSSEDGYQAVMAYVALYEATGEARWLTLASRAADWMLSFRWSYNLRFPDHTTLRTYDFRSRGADLASPRAQHLQGGGLVCLPEMVRLAKHTGDAYYLDRTRDNLACFLQFIARDEGDFNARQGMVTDRYHHSRGFQPKGSILPVSHARSAGLVLYACQAGLDLDE